MRHAAAGEITGDYIDVNHALRALVRDAKGNITTFAFPGSSWTGAVGINPAGVIIGDYRVQSTGAFGTGNHGFIWMP